METRLGAVLPAFARRLPAEDIAPDEQLAAILTKASAVVQEAVQLPKRHPGLKMRRYTMTSLYDSLLLYAALMMVPGQTS